MKNEVEITCIVFIIDAFKINIHEIQKAKTVRIISFDKLNIEKTNQN